MKIIEKIGNRVFFIVPPVYAWNITDPFSNLETNPCKLAEGATNFVLGLVIFIAVIFLAMGGIQYMQSGGDKMAVEQARGKITGAVVGAMVALGGFFILRLIIAVLGAGPLEDICKPTI